MQFEIEGRGLLRDAFQGQGECFVDRKRGGGTKDIVSNERQVKREVLKKAKQHQPLDEKRTSISMRILSANTKTECNCMQSGVTRASICCSGK